MKRTCMFHSVEEVLVGDEEAGDVRQRLSISGWFHKPQEGEEGYDDEPEVTAKSSLQQLVRSPFFCADSELISILF